MHMHVDIYLTQNLDEISSSSSILLLAIKTCSLTFLLRFFFLSLGVLSWERSSLDFISWSSKVLGRHLPHAGNVACGWRGGLRSLNHQQCAQWKLIPGPPVACSNPCSHLLHLLHLAGARLRFKRFKTNNVCFNFLQHCIEAMIEERLESLHSIFSDTKIEMHPTIR